jgi:hypothetical protein
VAARLNFQTCGYAVAKVNLDINHDKLDGGEKKKRDLQQPVESTFSHLGYPRVCVWCIDGDGASGERKLKI